MPRTPTAVDNWSTRNFSVGQIEKPAPRDVSLEASDRPTLIGQSPVMKRLFSVIERIAPTDSSVLITGATGTGKELVARAIHDRSPRREAAFVDINCSAI